jgi:hypothetical protein
MPDAIAAVADRLGRLMSVLYWSMLLAYVTACIYVYCNNYSRVWV